jgi:hypothetical protein
MPYEQDNNKSSIMQANIGLSNSLYGCEASLDFRHNFTFVIAILYTSC